MPVPLVCILIFFIAFFSLPCFVSKKPAGYVGGVLLLLIAISGCVWVGVAQNQPTRIESITRHEIRTVTYPDGSKKQMFTVNGTHYNANAKWDHLIDENEYEVEVVVPVTNYLGLSYATQSGGEMSTRYNLVKKAVK